MVSSGEAAIIRFYADGVLIAGEAANLLLNVGKAIQDGFAIGPEYSVRNGAGSQTAGMTRQIGGLEKTGCQLHYERH